MFNIPAVTLFGLLLRWSVSLFPYSGSGTPPMYGDYEAQRHWQEISINLPIVDWYRNTTDNDLLYWGFDYPPLTAYHSYICGLVAKFINSDYVTLHTSRGYESSDHKLFMRYSVFIVDLFFYFTASFIFSKYCNLSHSLPSKENNSKLSTYMALVLYPGLYLIDYGHFQYNCVSLGLFIAALAAACKDYDCVCTFFFSLALNYKQMELYHALPFFFFLLGKNFQKHSLTNCIYNISKLSFTVIAVFLCVWLPFLHKFELVLQVLSRIFPVGRGLFEDKVANFWCSISIFIKIKSIFDPKTMALICLITTLICLLPSCLHLLTYPKPIVFVYSMINCSFIFFLFSFHVHEKSILLVAIPMCLVYTIEPIMVKWFFKISLISLLPLLIRDGLLIPCLSLALISCYHLIFTDNFHKISLLPKKVCLALMNLSVLISVILSVLSVTIQPPLKYPDLYPVLISIYVCGHYMLFCFYFHYRQYQEGTYFHGSKVHKA